MWCMVLLDLHDGRAPIPCRDEHQARWLEGIWRAWCTGVAADMGLRDYGHLEPIHRYKGATTLAIDSSIGDRDGEQTGADLA
jgi:hypothetical protein